MIGRCLPALFLSGCSLFGLDDFEIPNCSTHNECQILNDRDQISPSACSRFLCDSETHTCLLEAVDLDQDGASPNLPGCGEIGPPDCNDTLEARTPGKREICDGLDNDCDADELVDEGVKLPPPEMTSTPFRARHVTFNTIELTGTQAVVAFSADRSAALLDFRAISSPENLTYTYTSTIDGRTKQGCPRADCNFEDLVFASDGDNNPRAASVSTSGCAQGRLIYGRLQNNTILLPPSDSMLYSGVDVAGLCTGAAPDLGAALPSIARLANATHVLITYFATDVRTTDPTADACAAGPVVPLKIMGLALEAPTDLRVLSRARAGARASIAAWQPARGFFVAHAAADRGIALHFAPLFTALELELFSRDSLHTERGRAGEVSLALGSIRAADGALELGVVWQTCDAPSNIWFARAAFFSDGTFASGPPQRVSTEGRAAFSPKIAYAPSGFYGSGSSSGGWMIAWREPQTRARRVSDRTGLLIDEPLIELSDVEPTALHLQLDATGYIRHSFYERAESTLWYGRASCLP